MPIGTSDGEHFEDAFHQAVVQQQQQQMTHQAPPPNTVAPAMEKVGKFLHGGLSEMLPDVGIPKAGDVLHSDTANAALGIFGGRYTPHAQAFAEALEAKGMSPEHIKQFARMERGAEGNWRREIPDTGSKSDITNTKPFQWKNGDVYGFNTLDQVLHHPEFFKAYPEAKDIGVVVDANITPNWGGFFNEKGNAIHINPVSELNSTPEGVHSTILHELQHWVQHREGFPLNVVDQIKNKYPESSRGIPDEEIYKHLSSEVEARNVQRRAEDPKLYKKLGASTEDVPREKQLMLSPQLRDYIDRSIGKVSDE